MSDRGQHSPLRCRVALLGALAGEYQAANPGEDHALVKRQPEIRHRGCLTLEDLQAVVRWKGPRNIGRVERNDDAYVREVTQFALGANTERARIETLTLLNGVQWPTASVILHFFHREPYPVLDFRAIWTLGLEEPGQYNFGFWWDYVQCCRELARRSNLDMRSLDRALWQYSKMHQAEG